MKLLPFILTVFSLLFPVVHAESYDLDPYRFSELQQILDPNARVYHSYLLDVPTRWTASIHPDFVAVVEVATAEDVERTVAHANAHNLPFLAKVSGHGTWPGLNELHGGIEIDLRRLDKVEIHEKGEDGRQSATLGGGVKGQRVLDELAKVGKRTVHGICGCVGLLGPALGGGHGLLQSLHGLGADQILSAQLVLANSSSITVSPSSHPNLFWAIRGAGHNFGIVTSVEDAIYDIPKKAEWHVATFVYKQTELEEVIEAANGRTEGEGAPEEMLIQWIRVLREPLVDPTNPIIFVMIIWEGNVEAFEAHIAPFRAIEHVSENIVTVKTWPAVLATSLPLDSPVCQPASESRIIGDIVLWDATSLSRYNVTATRKMFDQFAAITSEPAFAKSAMMLEGYGNAGVKRVPAESTAVSAEERNANLLIASMMFTSGSEGEETLERGRKANSGIIGALKEGHDEQRDGKRGVYVNYAGGEESIEEIYGWEEWRVVKLRALKEKWDPERRMSWYVPVEKRKKHANGKECPKDEL